MARNPTNRHKVASDSRLALALNIDLHPGYRDPFTRDQCPLAKIPNKARVRKISRTDQTDLHDPGALGTVLGSIGAPDVGVAYFVEWDDMPTRAVLIRENGIEPCT